MNIRKILSLALITVLSLGFTKAQAQAVANCVSGNNRTLVVSTDPSLGAPFTFIDPATGRPTGSDIATICAVAQLLGVNIELRALPFAQGLAGVAAGTIDVHISTITITRARLQQLAFVKYSDEALGMLFRGSVPAGVTIENALQPGSPLAGRTIAVITNSVHVGMVESIGATALQFPSAEQLGAAVESGAADAALSDLGLVATVATGNRVILQPVTPPPGTELLGLGIAINPRCCQLYVNIQAAINQLNANGTLAVIRNRFGVVPNTFTPSNLTPAECASFTPALVSRNCISQFIFNKYCPQGPNTLCNFTFVPGTGA